MEIRRVLSVDNVDCQFLALPQVRLCGQNTRVIASMPREEDDPALCRRSIRQCARLGRGPAGRLFDKNVLPGLQGIHRNLKMRRGRCGNRDAVNFTSEQILIARTLVRYARNMEAGRPLENISDQVSDPAIPYYSATERQSRTFLSGDPFPHFRCSPMRHILQDVQ